MATKVNQEKGIQYEVLGGGRRPRIVSAKNLREAGRIARRLFPRTKLIMVRRVASRDGQEYESHFIAR